MNTGFTVGGSESIDRFIDHLARCSYVPIIGAVKRTCHGIVQSGTNQWIGNS